MALGTNAPQPEIGKSMATEHQASHSKIRDWRGLLQEEPRVTKTKVFIALLILSASMTFTQLGFIGIGYTGHYVGYALGLLAPVAVASLLLGKGAGALFGLLSGGILYAHALLQPLDLFERFFVSLPNSVGLYTVCGLVMGTLFSVALHGGPKGCRRHCYLALACLVASIIAVGLFYLNATHIIATSPTPTGVQIDADQTLSVERRGATAVIGGITLATPLDFGLVCAICHFADYAVRRRAQGMGTISLRTAFRTQLIALLALVFAVSQAIIFVAITAQTERDAWNHMKTELNYLDDQLARSLRLAQGVLDAHSDGNLSDEEFNRLITTADPEEVLKGYNLDDGTIVVFYKDTVSFSYNPAFPTGAAVDELFDTWRSGTLDELARAENPVLMVYQTSPNDSESFADSELGYMRVIRFAEYHLMMAMPFSLVYANRQASMAWATGLALILLAAVYFIAARLLGRNVMDPIDNTNASLARITAGDLDVTISEYENVEFASLTAGINDTVSALKAHIAEAERRNEEDLATARAIQESTLPRTFPPFPEIRIFDIFASMNAAKVVGGDFFDYFLIDDHTLGFLIADVSGKGIPGALFMMTAKTELQNALSTGMDPATAIGAVNKALCANNDAGMFVTVWAATLNWETGLLTYVNAGHNYPLLRRGMAGRWKWLKKKCGPFLGAFDAARHRQETLTLEPGDTILLYTDGVNEAFNTNDDEYGNERFMDYLVTHSNLHPRGLVRGVRGSVAQWATGAEQSDDVTILALEYGVEPESVRSLTAPATSDSFDTANALLQDELERHDCPMDLQYAIVIAFEELFINVCNYAYADADEPGNICVNYSFGTTPSSVTIEFIDWGAPFNPLHREDPATPSTLAEVKIGGLGIYIVKQTMDDFTYTRIDDTNIVTFTKTW